MTELTKEPMRKKTLEQKASTALRQAALCSLVAFVGLALLAANDILNAETEGVLYYLAWAMMILGVSFALPSAVAFTSIQSEQLTRRR